MIARTFFAAVMLASPALAGPPLTTIQDVLYKADGTPFNGTLAISWSSFQASDNSVIATQIATVKIVNGNLRVQLVPTIGSTPPMVYSVTYNSDGRVQFQETWSVPTSAQPVHLRDIRVVTANLASADTGTSTVDESAVTGLTSDLAARPIKGPGYAATSVAIVNAGGALESATGNPTDCVHVDGSSGPCGGGSQQGPSFVDAESPAGFVDGNNTQFTLSALPNPPASLALYRNGLLQKAGQDYTLSGQSVSFLFGAPQPGETVLASYRLSAGDGTYSFLDSDSLSGTVDGNNTQFTLSAMPNPASSLALYRNGMLQNAGQDFTLNGQTVQFAAGATPQSGDTLLAWYRLSIGDMLAFVDGESPSGTVDGSNTQFALSAAPSPASSLAVFRNGLLLKLGQDYMLNGQTLGFVSAATPQTGDVLLASYRISASGAGALPTYPSAQVLCSGNGTVATAAVMSSMATCSIPAGVLTPGDRVEVRYDLEHQGAASGFSFETHWGGTVLAHRDALVSETLVTGRTDAGILPNGAQLSFQSWGASLPFNAGIVSAADVYSAGLTIDFQGMLSSATGDSLTLRNFSVVRVP